MNIFLDKSLPKKTQTALQVLRVVLFVLLFGSFFYAFVNPLAGDILLYLSIAIAVIFFLVKILVQRRRKNMAANEDLKTNVKRTGE